MIARSQGRLQDRQPVSVIDIGSNSIRLVVYEGIARSPTVLFNEKMLAGLGKGIANTGKLDPNAVTRSMEEFRRFRALSDQAGATDLYVLATAAAREAENGPEFIRRAEKVLGTKIRVLSGREEAYFSALGIISSFHKPDGIGEISAAAASNSSMSGIRTSAKESRCRSAACACRTWRRIRSRRLRRSPRPSWCAPNS